MSFKSVHEFKVYFFILCNFFKININIPKSITKSIMKTYKDLAITLAFDPKNVYLTETKINATNRI
jgi:hypothetical protein